MLGGFKKKFLTHPTEYISSVVKVSNCVFKKIWSFVNNIWLQFESQFEFLSFVKL